MLRTQFAHHPRRVFVAGMFAGHDQDIDMAVQRRW
jgi:hypothetical protein